MGRGPPGGSARSHRRSAVAPAAVSASAPGHSAAAGHRRVREECWGGVRGAAAHDRSEGGKEEKRKKP